MLVLVAGWLEPPLLAPLLKLWLPLLKLVLCDAELVECEDEDEEDAEE